MATFRLKNLLLSLGIFLYSTAAFSMDHLTVLLDWFINPDHAPLFVAKEKGFFKEQGLDVNLVGPADPLDPPKLVAAGKADIAITYQPQFLEQVDQGLPLVLLGILIDHPLNCLVTLENGPIKTIADLKGKTIGSSHSGVNRITLKIMLEKHGLTLNDVHLLNLHYNLTQALLTHKVDAVTGMMRNFEIVQMKLLKASPKFFYPEENGIPFYNELIFVINKKNKSDNRMPRFLTAVKRANQYLQQHPEETWQIFAKNHPELNNELNHQTWLTTLPYFAKNNEKLNIAQLQNFKKFMQKNQLIHDL